VSDSEYAEPIGSVWLTRTSLANAVSQSEWSGYEYAEITKLEVQVNDKRTDTEKYWAWVNAVLAAWELGWRCENGWVFIAPSGSRHDLSAADLRQLSRIERDGLFIANERDVS